MTDKLRERFWRAIEWRLFKLLHWVSARCGYVDVDLGPDWDTGNEWKRITD